MDQPSVERDDRSVKRFTTEYVNDEDRIKLSVQQSDGHVRVAWLTRRLCSKLISEMVKGLSLMQKCEYQNGQKSGGFSNSLQDGMFINQQRRKQMAALSNMYKEAVVSGDNGEVEEYLVRVLSVRVAQKGIVLELKSDEKSVIAILPLSEVVMRRWLVTLYAAYRKGEWGDNIWPRWISLREPQVGLSSPLLN